MNGPSWGFVLLGAQLGDGVRPLTLPQLRQLRARVRAMEPPRQPERQMVLADLTALGYDSDMAGRILALLCRQTRVSAWLDRALELDIHPLTCRDPGFPARWQRLGDQAPPLLFYRGDLSLLAAPAVALVGARRPNRSGAEFARRVGRLCAAEGLTLVSGNARGCDTIAQQACLAAGGRVVAVVADRLADSPAQPGVLYVSERGWDLPFSTERALSRNRLIHALGVKTLVAQTGNGAGGTWRGTAEHLQRGLGPVFVHSDGSAGALDLMARGAVGVSLQALTSLSALQEAQICLPGWEQL